MSSVRVVGFDLLRLHMVEVGPVRELATFVFTTDHGPANLFLVMGPNGSGKTSVLEAVYSCVSMLGSRTHARYGMDALDAGEGEVQLDVRVGVLIDGRAETIVMSIVLGTIPLYVSGPDSLDADEVARQSVLVYARQPGGGVAAAPFSDPLALDVIDAVSSAVGDQGSTLFGRDLALPSVLYFPATRGSRSSSAASGR